MRGAILTLLSTSSWRGAQLGTLSSPSFLAAGYGLDGRMIRVRFPAGAGNLSLRHHVQTGSGAHPASYPVGTRDSLPGGKGRGVKLTTRLQLVSRSKNV
jgi:hypothetical protein